MHQALKRLFARAGEGAALAEPPVDGGAFRKASAHWLRHFFANNAVNDGVSLIVLRDGLGQADIGTTSVYLRTEQRALVAEMGKMRRRGVKPQMSYLSDAGMASIKHETAHASGADQPPKAPTEPSYVADMGKPSSMGKCRYCALLRSDAAGQFLKTGKF